MLICRRTQSTKYTSSVLHNPAGARTVEAHKTKYYLMELDHTCSSSMYKIGVSMLELHQISLNFEPPRYVHQIDIDTVKQRE